MKEEEIESFAKTVEETQQRLLNQSYVKLTWQQMAEIYKELKRLEKCSEENEELLSTQRVVAETLYGLKGENE